MKTDLYRHFNADGVLLYVGVSLSAIERLIGHRGSKWSHEIANVTVEPFRSRNAALAAETKAIRIEKPLYNKKSRPICADDLCLRVHLTIEERRELRIAAAKADLSMTVLVRRLAMAALRQGVPVTAKASKAA